MCRVVCIHLLLSPCDWCVLVLHVCVRLIVQLCICDTGLLMMCVMMYQYVVRLVYHVCVCVVCVYNIGVRLVRKCVVARHCVQGVPQCGAKDMCTGCGSVMHWAKAVCCVLHVLRPCDNADVKDVLAVRPCCCVVITV